MLSRIFVGLVFIAACYFLYQVYAYKYVLDNIRDTAPANVMGPEIAPINIVAYLDYGSSWSRRAHPILLQILAENPDVNMIIKPYAGVSQESQFATRMALAAIQDNMFLDVHGILIDSPEGVSKDYIKQAMQLRGINYDSLASRINSESVNEMVDDIKMEALLHVKCTPHIYIENILVNSDNYTFNDMEKLA